MGKVAFVRRKAVRMTDEVKGKLAQTTPHPPLKRSPFPVKGKAYKLGGETAPHQRGLFVTKIRNRSVFVLSITDFFILFATVYKPHTEIICSNEFAI